jgi:hypothetical protein
MSKNKYVVKAKMPVSKTEKQVLLMNYSDEDIPKTSLAMLSPKNNSSPYLSGNKYESGKYILEKYAEEKTIETVKFDLLIADFMHFVFSQPPSHVYTAKLPLEAYCYWLVSAFLTPYLKSSERVVFCIDRKDLDNDFPLKSETHRIRKNKSNGSTDFVKQLCILLDKNIEIVSESYVPPFSWVSSNRDIRFQ